MEDLQFAYLIDDRRRMIVHSAMSKALCDLYIWRLYSGRL